MHNDDQLSPDDLAALYVAVALHQDDERTFEARVMEEPECRAAVRSFDAAAAVLFDCIEPVPPNVDTRTLLLARIADEVAPAPHSASKPPKIRRDSASAWRPSPMPGIAMRMLHIDREARRFSGLFRMGVGAIYPSHVHDQPEEILVLEGDLDFGDYALEAGDYVRLEAGTTHTEARTKSGCICWITAELPESLLA
jgi:anti-sigma factor ChrR (cupin superfamily)